VQELGIVRMEREGDGDRAASGLSEERPNPKVPAEALLTNGVTGGGIANRGESRKVYVSLAMEEVPGGKACGKMY
jgi:hypothetical protein